MAEIDLLVPELAKSFGRPWMTCQSLTTSTAETDTPLDFTLAGDRHHPAGNAPMNSETSVSRNSDGDLLRSLLPSGIASVVLHALTVAITIWCLRGCDRGMPSEQGGEVFRTVGLAQLQDRGSDIATGDSPLDETRPPQDGLQESIQPPTEIVPDTPPAVDELLKSATTRDATPRPDIPQTVGPGAPLPGLTPPGAAPPLVRSAGSTAGGGSQDAGPDDTIFMDIADSGETFVYLIDTSGSMGDGGRIGLAKTQLKSSIAMLKPHQKFQVVFYNESATQLKLGRRAQDVYPANDVNKRQAVSKIDLESPNYGTQYIPALKHALGLKPDVLYFLTDGVGVESNLKVDELLKLNTSGARIHVVEFASGERESRRLTWLQRLASRTNGKYRRVVVTGR